MIGCFFYPNGYIYDPIFLGLVKSAKINFIQISSPSIADGNISNINLQLIRRTPDGYKNKVVNLNEFNTMNAFQTGKITIPLANVVVDSNGFALLRLTTKLSETVTPGEGENPDITTIDKTPLSITLGYNYEY